MPFKPFSQYVIQVDEEHEEVNIEAWDADHPDDVFRTRRSYEDLERLLKNLSRDLTRW